MCPVFFRLFKVAQQPYELDIIMLILQIKFEVQRSSFVKTSTANKWQTVDANLPLIQKLVLFCDIASVRLWGLRHSFM